MKSSEIVKLRSASLRAVRRNLTCKYLGFRNQKMKWRDETKVCVVKLIY